MRQLRRGKLFRNWLVTRHLVFKYNLLNKSYHCVSTARRSGLRLACRNPSWHEALVEVLGSENGSSKSEVSRKAPQGIPGNHTRNFLGCPICKENDEQVKAFLGRPLGHAHFPYAYLDATPRPFGSHPAGGLPVRSWWPSASMLSASGRRWVVMLLPDALATQPAEPRAQGRHLDTVERRFWAFTVCVPVNTSTIGRWV